MNEKSKKRLFELLEGTGDGQSTKLFVTFITALIVFNVIAVILETVNSISSKYHAFFYFFDVFSVALFTIEYILRLWSCTSNVKFKDSMSGRIRFAMTPLALVDLIAVLPFYLPIVLPLDLRFLRILRVFRLMRFFKLVRYSKSLKTFGNVLNQKREELIIALFILVVLLIFTSSLLYAVEHSAQPEVFSSIPSSMWWGVATLTTIGYGDIYPVTPLGKFFGSIVAILGIGVFALPAGIMASGFSHETQKAKKVCPHCGRVV